MPLLDKYSGRGISDCHPRPEVPTGVKRCRDRALALKCVPSLRASRVRVGAVGERDCHPSPQRANKTRYD
jgi:hypothetical protein